MITFWKESDQHFPSREESGSKCVDGEAGQGGDGGELDQEMGSLTEMGKCTFLSFSFW